MRYFELALVATIGFSAIYHLVSTLAIYRWFSHRPEENGTPADLPVVTFFRPIKRGIPQLAEKIEMLAEAIRTGDQILLGVESGPDLEMCRTIAKKYPVGVIEIVVCESGGEATNPKVAKLMAMAPSARHEHWIVSDCETLMPRSFMEKFRREWIKVDVLTAGYRFTNAKRMPELLDVASTLITLWPGLAVSRLLGPVRFTLGACTGWKKSDFEKIGGFEKFRDYLAEDNQIGAAFSEAGKKIALSGSVLSIECDAMNWRGYFTHQHRVAKTYRVSNPAGFFGMILTHGVGSAVLLLALAPWEINRWLLFVSIVAVRVVTAFCTARVLAFPLHHLPLVIGLASLAETVFWMTSWLPIPVRWGSRRLALGRDGRIRR